MKKALCLAMILGIAATATAGIRLYVVEEDGTHGIAPPNVHNKDPFNFAPLGIAPEVDMSTPATIGDCGDQIEKTYFVYGVMDEEMGANDKIIGLNLNIVADGCMQIVDSTYYTSKVFGGFGQRWDGEGGYTLEDGRVAAVTGQGIQYGGLGGGDPLYNVATHEFLLGAFTVACGDGEPGCLELGLGGLGGAYNVGGGSTAVLPVYVGGTLVGADESTPILCCVPEPASLLLIGLAGLVIRRR